MAKPVIFTDFLDFDSGSSSTDAAPPAKVSDYTRSRAKVLGLLLENNICSSYRGVFWVASYADKIIGKCCWPRKNCFIFV